MDYGSKAVNGNGRCSRDLDQETFGVILSDGHGAAQGNASPGSQRDGLGSVSRVFNR